jgi:hypothetical protein
MCPVRALKEWLKECGNLRGYLFRKVMAGDRVDMANRPLVRFEVSSMVMYTNQYIRLLGHF